MMQPGALITVIAGLEDSKPVILRARYTGPSYDRNDSIDVRLIDCAWARTATFKTEDEGVTWMRGWGERQKAILRATQTLQELA